MPVSNVLYRLAAVILTGRWNSDYSGDAQVKSDGVSDVGVLEHGVWNVQGGTVESGDNAITVTANGIIPRAEPLSTVSVSAGMSDGELSRVSATICVPAAVLQRVRILDGRHVKRLSASDGGSFSWKFFAKTRRRCVSHYDAAVGRELRRRGSGKEAVRRLLSALFCERNRNVHERNCSGMKI